jgi:hypothetical protein
MDAYEGGCHCQRVRYKLYLPKHHRQVLDCNCSMCFKKGILHLIVRKEQFKILSGQEYLETYTFNTRVAKHFFCKVCGIHPFYVPRSHPDDMDVNIRTLDIASLDFFEIKAFDGRNWENKVKEIQSRSHL